MPGRVDQDMDPGPRLFDPARTMKTVCPACGATREPGEERSPTCAADRDNQRRPHQCLNRTDNRHTEIPF